MKTFQEQLDEIEHFLNDYCCSLYNDPSIPNDILKDLSGVKSKDHPCKFGTKDSRIIFTLMGLKENERDLIVKYLLNKAVNVTITQHEVLPDEFPGMPAPSRWSALFWTNTLQVFVFNVDRDMFCKNILPEVKKKIDDFISQGDRRFSYHPCFGGTVW